MATEKETVNEKLQKQVKKHPAYFLLLRYIGSDLNKLHCCTFRYIVEAMQGEQTNWYRVNVAWQDFKLDENYNKVKPFIESKDPVSLAKKLVELDVVKDDD